MMMLKEIEVNVDQLFLDPNNPRYADIEEIANPVPDDKVADDKVQKKAMERIMNPRLEVQQLMDSIRTIGYLIVDRMVVVPLREADKYKVIEGNRRLGAIKALLEDYETGEIDIDDSILSTLKKYQFLFLKNPIKKNANILVESFKESAMFQVFALGGLISKRNW